MAISNKTVTTPINSKEPDFKVTNAQVTRAKFMPKSNDIAFDMIVNDITIYGMIYRARKNKNGEEFEVLAFPQYKGTNGKYYSHCYFPISDALKADIISQLDTIVNGGTNG